MKGLGRETGISLEVSLNGPPWLAAGGGHCSHPAPARGCRHGLGLLGRHPPVEAGAGYQSDKGAFDVLTGRQVRGVCVCVCVCLKSQLDDQQ